MVAPSPASVRVSLEIGRRRTFAAALDWPGWARSGRSEDDALAALRAYAPRYEPVARGAGEEPPDPARLDVVERIVGSASTDFGVLAGIAERDREPPGDEVAATLLRLVESSWAVFDRIVACAPAVLRKGPRGGGRDRDAIVDHVLGAEAEAYAPKLGARLPRPRFDDAGAVAAHRSALLATLLEAATRVGPSPRWPPRYAARRIAWHVLDHAWEIEDRAEP